jgi:hypothetical protein
MIRCFLLGATSLGWTLQARAPLAAVLVMGFFVGLGTGTNNTGKSPHPSVKTMIDGQQRFTART